MDQTLIRADMVAIIANKTGLDKDVVDKTMLCFIDTVIDELSKDNKIKLNGFGSFENTHMKSRTVSSPLTGRTMEISERVLPRFKPSKSVKDIIRRGVARLNK